MPPFDANATITPVALTLTSVNAPTGSALTSNVVQVQLSRADTGQAINGATVNILVRPELGTVWTTAVITTDVEGVGTTTFKAPVDASITATTQAGVWYNASRARSYIRIKPALSAVLSTVSVKQRKNAKNGGCSWTKDLSPGLRRRPMEHGGFVHHFAFWALCLHRPDQHQGRQKGACVPALDPPSPCGGFSHRGADRSLTPAWEDVTRAQKGNRISRCQTGMLA